jgi:ribonuclease Z
VDERLPAAGAVLQAREVREGLALERSGLRVLAFAVDHGPPSPALGYRVEFQGRSVVLSGDTRPSENLVKFARGADLVIHEVVAPEAERRRARVDPALIQRIIDRHTTAEDAGKLFARIRPRLAVFSHIVPSVAGEEDILPDARKHYDGPLVCGRDLMRIAVGEKVEVLR